MAHISWDLEDPIVQRLQFTQDNLGHWNISVNLREHWAGSLGSKIVKVTLVGPGLIFGKDIGSATWTPARSGKNRTKPAKKTLPFQTRSDEYPKDAKVEIEFSEA